MIPYNQMALHKNRVEKFTEYSKSANKLENVVAAVTGGIRVRQSRERKSVEKKKSAKVYISGLRDSEYISALNRSMEDNTMRVVMEDNADDEIEDYRMIHDH